jgi:hypothetical protein
VMTKVNFLLDIQPNRRKYRPHSTVRNYLYQLL